MRRLRAKILWENRGEIVKMWKVGTIECAAVPQWRILGTKGGGGSYSIETEENGASCSDEDGDDDVRGEGEVNSDFDLIRR